LQESLDESTWLGVLDVAEKTDSALFWLFAYVFQSNKARFSHVSFATALCKGFNKKEGL